MSMCGSLFSSSFIECNHDLQKQYKEFIVDIGKKSPSTAKEMKRVLKSAAILSISDAGNLGAYFDKDGKHHPNDNRIIKKYKYKIVYWYPYVTNEKFNYLLN